MYEIKECEVEATLLEEVFRKALKALTNGKSPGYDGILIELLKGSRRRSNKGVNINMPTNLDKKDLAKKMEGVSLCTNTKKEMPEYEGNQATLYWKRPRCRCHPCRSIQAWW